ncbi:MAG TPA: hypothetical protein VMX11_05785, partial [Actinomycetes bacterium]|nr:hypothetical protein [Actinomycetes bacterium]
MGVDPQHEPESVSRVAGPVGRSGSAGDADVIEGGGQPRRELPRGLVLGAKLLLGVVAVVWLGVVVADQLQGTPAEEAPRLSVVGEPVPSYQAGHGQFGVNLHNDSQTSVVVDYAAILDDSSPAGSELLAPSWAAAKV